MVVIEYAIKGARNEAFLARDHVIEALGDSIQSLVNIGSLPRGSTGRQKFEMPMSHLFSDMIAKMASRSRSRYRGSGDKGNASAVAVPPPPPPPPPPLRGGVRHMKAECDDGHGPTQKHVKDLKRLVAR